MQSPIPHLAKIETDLDNLMKAARKGEVRLKGEALAGVAIAGIKLKSANRIAQDMEQGFLEAADLPPACERGLPVSDL